MIENQGKFDEIMKRLQTSKKTKIKSHAELCRVLEKNSGYVYKMKSKNEFPIKWAFIIGQKFNECPIWIMTGKHRPNCTEKKLAVLFGKWMEIKEEEDPRNEVIIEVELEKAFPEFKTWKEKQFWNSKTE